MAPPLDASLLNGLKLGLEGEHQYQNAGLAVALCYTWLHRTGHLEITNLEQTVSSAHKSSPLCHDLLYQLIHSYFLKFHGIELFARVIHQRSNNSQYARAGSDGP